MSFHVWLLHFTLVSAQMSHQVGLFLPLSIKHCPPGSTHTPSAQLISFSIPLDFFLHSIFYSLNVSWWFIYFLSSTFPIKHAQESRYLFVNEPEYLGTQKVLEKKYLYKELMSSIHHIQHVRLYHAVSETQLFTETQMRKIIFREDNFRNKLSIYCSWLSNTFSKWIRFWNIL